MTSRVGLPVCRGLVAFGNGDYAQVLDELGLSGPGSMSSGGATRNEMPWSARFSKRPSGRNGLTLPGPS